MKTNGNRNNILQQSNFNFLIVFIYAFLMLACTPPANSQGDNARIDETIPTPSFTYIDIPLGDEPFLVPNIYILEVSKSITELVSDLKTTEEMLKQVNPSLSDIIEPSTTIVIPNYYRIGDDESLADIAVKVDIPESILRLVNPSLKAEKGQTLNIPPIYVTHQEISLDQIMNDQKFEINIEASLAANSMISKVTDSIEADTAILLISTSQ